MRDENQDREDQETDDDAYLDYYTRGNDNG